MKGIVLSIALLLNVGCENPVDPLESRIFGTVTDIDTGETIENVEINFRVISSNGNGISWEQTHTNKNGEYEITVSLYKSRDYYLEFYKNGYEIRKPSIQRKDSQRLDMQLLKLKSDNTIE